MAGDQFDASVSRAESPRGKSKGLSRRQLIKASAAAGAVAWTAPAIIDSLASPASAFTPPPCPNGKAYAVVYSPPGAAGVLVDRLPDTNGFGTPPTVNNCTNLPPSALCSTMQVAGRTRTYAGSVALQVNHRNISHDITEQFNGLNNAVDITLDPTSCCTIEKVFAYVHKFQAASQGGSDCPTPYCQEALTTAGAYLLKTVNSAKSWTVTPSSNSSLCGGVGVHWGSPNLDQQCAGYDSAAQSDGQPFGYMLILLDCHTS
jgi:hypothetical protein